MSILQELEDSLLSDSPVWMEFLYRYDPKKKQIFAFYEGDEDPSFYRQFIIKILNSEYELEEIIAGCKNNVLKLQKSIDWDRYNAKQLAFFVDRDLSFWLGQPLEYGGNVFVTDEYSVENYICNSHMFRVWLQRFEGFSRASKKEIDYMMDIYEGIKPVFETYMKPIMAKAVVAKRHNPDIALKKYKPSFEFFNNDDDVNFNITNQNIINDKWDLSDEDDEEVQYQVQEFDEHGDYYFVRGKWFLLFMLQLGEHMRLNGDFFAPSLDKKGKLSPTCAVSTSQGLTALAPNWESEPPRRLQTFLNVTYGEYMAV